MKREHNVANANARTMLSVILLWKLNLAMKKVADSTRRNIRIAPEESIGKGFSCKHVTCMWTFVKALLTELPATLDKTGVPDCPIEEGWTFLGRDPKTSYMTFRDTEGKEFSIRREISFPPRAAAVRPPESAPSKVDGASWAISPPPGWEIFWERNSELIKGISQKLPLIEPSGASCLPTRENIFAAFRRTPLDSIRVVIIGQDPYHTVRPDGTPVAIGVSFGASAGTREPPSLRTIFDEIAQEFPHRPRPTDTTLEGWTSQGVFMLNSTLTVNPGEPGNVKHMRLWEAFTQHVVKEIAKSNKAVFLLWGKKAREFTQHIGNCPRLETSHPSPLSATRGFKGCGHFLKTNEILMKKGLGEIAW